VLDGDRRPHLGEEVARAMPFVVHPETRANAAVDEALHRG
jgi:hypothetical protein